MTSSSQSQSSLTSRWKSYCAKYDAFFDRHPVTHAIYTFCLLFTILCLLQFFGLHDGFLSHGISGSVILAALLAIISTVVRQRAAHKRRSELQ